ncbi:MAG: DnaD domain protein, partial [Oscillospiraceae bacterium]|nr:DnaD domain protein [Oscillospiraceae bacterium]
KWEGRVKHLKQYRGDGRTHRKAPNRSVSDTEKALIGSDSEGVPVPVPVPEPVPESSSVDDDKPHGGTTTTPALSDAYERTFGAPPTNHVTRKLEEYAGKMGPELVCRVLEECERNGAKGWGYARTALEDCAAKGTTLEEYERAHRRDAPSKKVDRPEPSGTDILARRRPIRLKRED